MHGTRTRDNTQLIKPSNKHDVLYNEININNLINISGLIWKYNKTEQLSEDPDAEPEAKSSGAKYRIRRSFVLHFGAVTSLIPTDLKGFPNLYTENVSDT